MLASDAQLIVSLWNHLSFLHLSISCCLLIMCSFLLLLLQDIPCVSPLSRLTYVVIVGNVSSSFSFLLNNLLWVGILMRLFYVWTCRYIYNDRTPFEKLADSYFCPGIHFILTQKLKILNFLYGEITQLLPCYITSLFTMETSNFLQLLPKQLLNLTIIYQAYHCVE